MKKIFRKTASLLACVPFFMGVLSIGFASCDSETKTPNLTDDDGGALSCVEQMLDGCSDISNEVGEAKIGDPLSLYNDGQTEKALYSVESWYSWRSRQDYSNNILSVRNVYYGSLDGTVATHSLSALLATANASLDTKMKDAIKQAYDAILAIPDPFCQNINCEEAKEAQEKCADLDGTIKEVKSYIQNDKDINTNEVLDPIVNNYVDVVVLPTYKTLSENADLLYTAVLNFRNNPSDDAFSETATAWIAAREPWEKSEAFLGFGPVDTEGLDPNMDSWPLDQDQIANILKSNNYDSMEWKPGDDDDAIANAQNIRGFHTLEFLIFKEGHARTTSDTEGTGSAGMVWNESNRNSWGNYMLECAKLLKDDANTLYDSWSKEYKNGKSYATLFKEHSI